MKRIVISTQGENMVIGMLLILTLGLSISCSRKVIVPVERCVRDTIHEIRYRTDSIYERDSVQLEVKGDTVIKEVFRWRERIRHRTDTIIRTRVDSVPVIIPSESQQAFKSDKERSSYSKIKREIQSIFSAIGKISLILLILLIAKRIKRP